MRLIGSARRPVATFCLCAGMLLAGALDARQAAAPGGATGAQPEVTFLHISDQHYGAKNFDPPILKATIDAMNQLAGTPYPDAVGGVVGTPRGNQPFCPAGRFCAR